MPIVVCDSSTLIHLARIGRLSLLKDFHGKIIVVPAVWNEVVEEGQGKPGSSEIRDACESGWIEVISPHNGPLVQLLQRELHKGESETIALAVELHADLAFLDESCSKSGQDLRAQDVRCSRDTHQSQVSRKGNIPSK